MTRRHEDRRRSRSSQAFSIGKVGYPDEWKDYSTVDVKRDDYFGNAPAPRAVRAQARLREDRQADRPHGGA